MLCSDFSGARVPPLTHAVLSIAVAMLVFGLLSSNANGLPACVLWLCSGLDGGEIGSRLSVLGVANAAKGLVEVAVDDVADNAGFMQS